MKNKKSIMAFSAMQILFFHLWIYMLNGNKVEMFLKQTAYIGVDIFFFLSAYSLAKREIKNYFSFIGFRLRAVYWKFFLFAVAAAIYGKWKLPYFCEVISGVNLFKKGGGAFLWFLPAIVIFYFLYPLFQKADGKNRWVTLAGTLTAWILGAYFMSANKGCYPVFIFWNRIPIFLLGHYCSVGVNFEKIKCPQWVRPFTGVLLTAIGTVLMYRFGFTGKLQVPFKDMFYLCVIPVCLGLVILVSYVPEWRVIKWIGSSSLEMYAVQMIFGYNVAGKILKQTKNKALTNAGACFFVIVTAILLHYGYELMGKEVRKYVQKIKDV